MIEGVFGQDLTAMQRAMDLRLTRQQLLSSDVANIDTPGYHHVDLDFATSLQRVLAADAAANSQGVLGDGAGDASGSTSAEGDSNEPVLKIDSMPGLFNGPDSNSANIELLMGRMQENSVQYQIATQMVGARFKAMRDTLDSLDKS